ncbi:MAG: Xyloglucanase Xgh74A precursor [Firmicutes bacterium ADurb.Bin419]|nr:MAG: Xyloglucanase Xgh74A precursor [Firmicutes bacterium ADurb.Bin419]
MKQHLLGMIKEFPYEHGAKAGDVDGNGVFNSIDFGYMKQYLLGMIPKLPAEK